MLAQNGEAVNIRWLQLCLFRGWIAQLEKRLQGIIPTIQPYCLVSMEDKQILGFSLIRAINRKGTCWEINLPNLIKEPKRVTTREITNKIFKQALAFENCRAHSWITRCDITETDRIAALRELGFQPLKLLSTWNQKNKIGSPKKTNLLDSIHTQNLDWKPINNNNIKLLFQLRNSGESSQLRQILDLHYQDLIDERKEGCGVLLDRSSKKGNAIFAIISRKNFIDFDTFEILREPGWDHRIDHIMPDLLTDLYLKYPNTSIEVNNEDINLIQLLKEHNWEKKKETMLLGRTLWRRQSSKSILKANNSIEAIIEGLSPQSPPLPTPTLGKD